MIFIKETIASDVQGGQNVLTMSWEGKTDNPIVDPFALFGTSPLLRWDLATGAASCSQERFRPNDGSCQIYPFLRRHSVF